MAEPRISMHILPTSATMAGVSVTVASVVRLMESSTSVSTVVDLVMVGDAVVFLLSCLLSYASLRGTEAAERLERRADALFMAGLVVMVLGSLLLAFELA